MATCVLAASRPFGGRNAPSPVLKKVSASGRRILQPSSMIPTLTVHFIFTSLRHVCNCTEYEIIDETTCYHGFGIFVARPKSATTAVIRPSVSLIRTFWTRKHARELLLLQNWSHKHNKSLANYYHTFHNASVSQHQATVTDPCDWG